MKAVRILLLVLVLSTALLGCSEDKKEEPQPTPEATAEPQAADSVRILRLDSYHIEFPWTAEITRGTLEALAENGYVVDSA